MDRSQFRFHYLMSILLSFFGSLLFIGAIMFFLFNTTYQVGGEMFNPNSSDASSIKVMLDVVYDFLFKSAYAIIGIIIFAIGVIWNIVISFMRGSTQNNQILGIVVTIGWLLAFFVPIFGLIVSAIIQIWGWFQGSKDLYTNTVNATIVR